jgi:hypothetical protein
MYPANSSEALILIYKKTKCNNLEDHNLIFLKVTVCDVLSQTGSSLEAVQNGGHVIESSATSQARA